MAEEVAAPVLPLDLSEVLNRAVSSDTISVLELRLSMKKFIEDAKMGKVAGTLEIITSTHA